MTCSNKNDKNAVNGPLENLKVLDFTRLLPGPFATMMLADLGAKVVKVEDMKRPDILRFVPPIVDGVGAVYAHVNRGKKSLALEFGSDGARDILLRLVQEYDIIVEQFRPGVMDSLGLGYDEMKKIKPSIIYCSLTGYGQEGSYATRAGHDINYLALSGVESFSGRADSGPVLSGIQVGDVGAGAKDCALSICAAYIARKETGRGSRIDISITDSLFAMTFFSTVPFLAGGDEPGRETGGLNGGTLYDFYVTADGRYLSVGPIEAKFFRAFCEAIGEPEYAERGIGDREIKKSLARIIAGKDLAYWADIFQDRDACVEPVLTTKEAIGRPPLSDRNMIITVSTGEGTPLRQIAPAIRMDGLSWPSREAGARLGRHNEEILDEAGYSPCEVSDLRTRGLVL